MSEADVRASLSTVFKECDKDKSGKIDAKEVEDALRRCQNCPGCKEKWDEARIKKEAADFLKQADKDKDSKVSEKEFVDFYTARLSK